MKYTVEIYKMDKRIKKNDRYGKNKVGLRFINATDLDCDDQKYELFINMLHAQGFVTDTHETYVTRKNLMTGEEFQERYDTPYFCSPSSESYYSM